MVRTSRNRKPQKVDEAAAAVENQAEPPIILRWQDLPRDDPGSRMIYIAPEDYTAPPGKGKGKAKDKDKEKEKGKGKEPALANYIRMGEELLACKMCPNPDRHRTINCPNLTPELKERLKDLRSRFGDSKAFDPDNKGCHICEKRDHWSSHCPYLFVYPPGAHVGPYAEMICLCCGEMNAHEGKLGFDWEARCRLKVALSYPKFKP
ncbi:hypothetical protein ACLB2K_077123 [Fragaria x ananassa]